MNIFPPENFHKKMKPHIFTPDKQHIVNELNIFKKTVFGFGANTSIRFSNILYKIRHMKKIILTLSLALAFSGSFLFRGNAQTTQKNNWFVSAGLGPNILFGEQDRLVSSLDKRVRLSGELTVGKWINPRWGVRAQLNAGRLQGWNSFYDMGKYVSPGGSAGTPGGHPDLDYYCNKGTDGFFQTFHYGSLTADVMMNLTNVIAGDGQNHKIDILPFAGLGYLHAVKSCTNPTFDGWLAKFGGRVNCNLGSGRTALYGEAQCNVADETFDGYVGDRYFNLYLNVLFGVQYNFR